MSPVIKKTTWIAIADGAKALLLLNEGTDAAPRLRVLAKSELDNPPTRDQGTDRPGRMADSGPGQRSALETTDWHEFEEQRFARDLAERLNRTAERDRFDRLILVAPPKVLGALRPALAPAVIERLGAELPNDLTRHPLDEIERLLKKALWG